MRRGHGTSYRSAHRKVYRAKGRARDYACVECGGGATDWSYDGLDPDEMHGSNNVGTAPRAYSMDPNHYQPRCRRCHLQKDRAVEVCAQGHLMSEAGKRQGVSRGCAQCARDRARTYQTRVEVKARRNAVARSRTREQRDKDNARAARNRANRVARETPEEAAERRAVAARKARERRARRGLT